MKERNNRNDDKTNHTRSGSSYNKPHFNGFNILPSARVLDEYESVAPGSVNKLLDMAKKEQEHRHSWQDRYLKYHNLTYRSGQVFGFAYNILLLYVIYTLIHAGNFGVAVKLFIANVLLIALAILVTYTERKLTTRKPPRRSSPNDNTGRPAHPSRKNHNNPNQVRTAPREHSVNREQHGNRKPRNQ